MITKWFITFITSTRKVVSSISDPSRSFFWVFSAVSFHYHLFQVDYEMTLTCAASVELDPHWNVVHPCTCIHTHKPRSEWRIKSVFFDRVVITVSSEHLQEIKKRKQELHTVNVCVVIASNKCSFIVFKFARTFIISFERRALWCNNFQPKYFYKRKLAVQEQSRAITFVDHLQSS